jgi:DMSO/TMAO reductase YedYZ molybdopterin-dependent catalytic subunit
LQTVLPLSDRRLAFANLPEGPALRPHGAPVRSRVARQLGYMSVKYLSRITVADRVKNIRKGLGSVQPEYGYSWLAGI